MQLPAPSSRQLSASMMYLLLSMFLMELRDSARQFFSSGLAKSLRLSRDSVREYMDFWVRGWGWGSGYSEYLCYSCRSELFLATVGLFRGESACRISAQGRGCWVSCKIFVERVAICWAFLTSSCLMALISYEIVFYSSLTLFACPSPKISIVTYLGLFSLLKSQHLLTFLSILLMLNLILLSSSPKSPIFLSSSVNLHPLKSLSIVSTFASTDQKSLDSSSRASTVRNCRPQRPINSFRTFSVTRLKPYFMQWAVCSLCSFRSSFIQSRIYCRIFSMQGPSE